MKQRRQFVGVFLINFFMTLGLGIADSFFSVYVYDLGARGIFIVLPILAYSLAKILLSPSLGSLTDTLGRKEAVVGSLLLQLFVSLGLAVTSNFVMLAMLKFAQGGACAMFRPGLVTLAGESASPHRRATIMGTFDISFYAALALGPLIGGVVKDSLGITAVFRALSVLCCVALLVAWACISPECRSRTVAAGSPRVEGGRAAQVAASDPVFAGLLAFIFGRACGISLLGTFLPIFLATKQGFSATQIGFVMTSSTLMMMLLLRPAGALSDRSSRVSLVVAGGLLVAMLYLLIPMLAGFYNIILLGTGIGLFSVLSQPASTAMLLELGQRYGTGTVFGTFNAVLNAGFAMGPLVGAALHGLFGLSAVFYGAGVLGICSALFLANNEAIARKEALGGEKQALL